MLNPKHQPAVDKSGSITAGGTAQDVYSKQDAPTYWINFQNISDTAMWIRFGKTATADKGIYIPAGGYWEPPAGILPGGNLSVLCATTGKKFLCNLL
jgi:hypothetical protein